MATDPIECELAFAKKGLVKRGEKWSADSKRRDGLPDAPAGFSAVRGPYGQIARQATKLNEAQMRSGFWDWVFSPEPLKKKEEGQ